MSVETFPVGLPTPSPTPPSASGVDTPKETRSGQTPAAPVSDTPEARERYRQAELIIRRNTFWALGAGALIVPFVDTFAAMAVQLKLIKNLSDLYGARFSEGLAMKLLGALVLGTSGPVWGTSISSLVKLIPGVGTALGAVVCPLATAACTHALGRIFMLHFEAGGTLLDFEPKRVREHFQREYERSQESVARMREELSGPEAPRPPEPAAK